MSSVVALEKKNPFKRDLWGLSPAFIVLFVMTAIFFLLWPEVDLWFSGLFWTPEEDFFLRNQPLVVLIYRSVEWSSYGVGGGFAVWLAVLFGRPRLRKPGRIRFAFFALLLLALGPGLVVNFVFKDHWGRARPSQVEAFGGEAVFTPAFVMGKACDRNCSFASGHASAAAWLLCLTFFHRSRKRWLMLTAGMYYVLAGLGRIIQGGHFLSDVVFAFLMVYLVAALLDRWLPRYSPYQKKA